MLKRETKFYLAVTIVFVLIIAVWLATLSSPRAVEEKTYDENRPDVGSQKAEVVIANYFDFYCSHCKVADASLRRVMDKYGNRILVKYRYFPLSSDSVLADVAAECAQQQNRFSAYHNLLFSSYNSIVYSSEKLISLAKQVGLDDQKFTACMNDAEMTATVAYDLRMAAKQGVAGLPAIFVNGNKINWQNLENEVEKYLNK